MVRAYNTKQKQAILTVLEESGNKCLSVKEIAEKLLKYDIKVANATIYRYLDRLTVDGLVGKIFDDNSKSGLYQYLDLDDKHWHLRCYRCGELIHMNCKQLDELTLHIKEEHDFYINNSRLVINGLCQKCSK